MKLIQPFLSCKFSKPDTHRDINQIKSKVESIVEECQRKVLQYTQDNLEMKDIIKRFDEVLNYQDESNNDTYIGLA